MDSPCYCLSIVPDLVLHRRRFHVDLSHGDRFESELRYLQQAMATETEKEKKFCPADDGFRLSSYALLHRHRQLFVFQCGYHG